MGTIFQIAQELNTNINTIRYYGTNTYKRRLAKRKKSNNSRILIELEETQC
ncbi:hypothetical protein ACSXD3_17825 (plasmid) [Clostridium perfringens]